MLEKNSTTSDKYKPNDMTAITVRNVRKQNERGDYYRTEVTIKVRSMGDTPLLFNSIDEIDKFVNDIDFEDPNTTLFPDEPTKELPTKKRPKLTDIGKLNKETASHAV